MGTPARQGKAFAEQSFSRSAGMWQPSAEALLQTPTRTEPGRFRRQAERSAYRPFGPGSADESLAFFHCLPRNHQHRPADKVCADTVPAVFARRPWSVPAAISGTGLASAASSNSRPSRKFKLTHENSPLCSRAYSPAASFSCVTILPGIKETVSRSTEAARACWPVVRPEASTDQTRPWDQSKSGTNSKSPAHSPRRRR